MTEHIKKERHVDCNDFLGGISKNYTTNLLLSDKSDLAVIEADEYDRSFHHLHSYMAVITATDADHLDIYGTHEAYLESFAHFTSLIQPGGCLIAKKGIQLNPRLQEQVTLYSYSSTEVADFYADNIVIANGELWFDFITPTERIEKVQLGVPVLVNVENAVAAMALAYLNGVTPDELRKGMQSFAGIRRRFDIHFKSDHLVVIDDYAHHPAELKASRESVKRLYHDKNVLGVFQPHLYSRTNDFYDDFAQALSLLDDVVLLEIYPARELPMQGVTSELILNNITHNNKILVDKNNLVNELKNHEFDVLLTVGAGDIDTYIPEIINALTKD